MPINFTVIIPTKDREEQLGLLMRSISTQTVLPYQVIIVDASIPKIESSLKKFNNLNIVYRSVYPPSLTAQKNIGIDLVEKSCDLVCFLDDDIILEDNSIENMLNFWSLNDENVAGAAFNILNSKPQKASFIKKLLLVDSDEKGIVLKSGVATGIPYTDTTIRTEWLYGGATVWKKKIIDLYRYDEDFSGIGYLEDVDFSYNIGKKYKLYQVSTARLHHFSAPVKGDKEMLLGKYQIVNRIYLVKKYKDKGLSITQAWVANLSYLLLNISAALIKLDRRYFNRACGNIIGIYLLFTNQKIEHEHLK